MTTNKMPAHFWTPTVAASAGRAGRVKRAVVPIMLDLVLEILAFFGWVHDADGRPEARSLTVGCAAIVLLVVAAVGAAVFVLR